MLTEVRRLVRIQRQVEQAWPCYTLCSLRWRQVPSLRHVGRACECRKLVGGCLPLHRCWDLPVRTGVWKGHRTVIATKAGDNLVRPVCRTQARQIENSEPMSAQRGFPTPFSIFSLWWVGCITDHTVNAAPHEGWNALAKSPAEQLPFQYWFNGWCNTSHRGPPLAHAATPASVVPHNAAVRSKPSTGYGPVLAISAGDSPANFANVG